MDIDDHGGDVILEVVGTWSHKVTAATQDNPVRIIHPGTVTLLSSRN